MSYDYYYILYEFPFSEEIYRELIGRPVCTNHGVAELHRIAEELSNAGYNSVIVKLPFELDPKYYCLDSKYRRNIYAKVIHRRYADNFTGPRPPAFV